MEWFVLVLLFAFATGVFWRVARYAVWRLLDRVTGGYLTPPERDAKGNIEHPLDTSARKRREKYVADFKKAAATDEPMHFRLVNRLASLNVTHQTDEQVDELVLYVNAQLFPGEDHAELLKRLYREERQILEANEQEGDVHFARMVYRLRTELKRSDLFVGPFMEK